MCVSWMCVWEPAGRSAGHAARKQKQPQLLPFVLPTDSPSPPLSPGLQGLRGARCCSPLRRPHWVCWSESWWVAFQHLPAAHLLCVPGSVLVSQLVPWGGVQTWSNPTFTRI